MSKAGKEKNLSMIISVKKGINASDQSEWDQEADTTPERDGVEQGEENDTELLPTLGTINVEPSDDDEQDEPQGAASLDYKRASSSSSSNAYSSEWAQKFGSSESESDADSDNDNDADDQSIALSDDSDTDSETPSLVMESPSDREVYLFSSSSSSTNSFDSFQDLKDHTYEYLDTPDLDGLNPTTDEEAIVKCTNIMRMRCQLKRQRLRTSLKVLETVKRHKMESHALKLEKRQLQLELRHLTEDSDTI